MRDWLYKRGNIFLLLYLCGICLGLLWYLFAWNQNMQTSAFFSIYTYFQVKQMKLDAKTVFFQNLLRQCGIVISYLFLCTTTMGKVVEYLMPIGLGSTLGVLSGVLIGRFEVKGIWLLLCTCLPQWIFYWIGSRYLFIYGTECRIKKVLLPSGKEALVRLIICFAVGNMVVAIINPYLLNLALRYF